VNCSVRIKRKKNERVKVSLPGCKKGGSQGLGKRNLKGGQGKTRLSGWVRKNRRTERKVDFLENGDGEGCIKRTEKIRGILRRNFGDFSGERQGVSFGIARRHPGEPDGRGIKERAGKLPTKHIGDQKSLARGLGVFSFTQASLSGGEEPTGKNRHTNNDKNFPSK